MLTQVLSGLGGVGKTQLAANYAHAAWRDAAVELVVWVTASSRETIQASYAQAAREIATTVPVEAEQSAAWLMGWLQTTHRPWLIVLDDLSDPADLQGLWPAGSAGHCLVTTRRRASLLAASPIILIAVATTVVVFTARRVWRYPLFVIGTAIVVGLGVGWSWWAPAQLLAVLGVLCGVWACQHPDSWNRTVLRKVRSEWRRAVVYAWRWRRVMLFSELTKRTGHGLHRVHYPRIRRVRR